MNIKNYGEMNRKLLKKLKSKEIIFIPSPDGTTLFLIKKDQKKHEYLLTKKELFSKSYDKELNELVKKNLKEINELNKYKLTNKEKEWLIKQEYSPEKLRDDYLIYYEEQSIIYKKVFGKKREIVKQPEQNMYETVSIQVKIINKETGEETKYNSLSKASIDIGRSNNYIGQKIRNQNKYEDDKFKWEIL